MTLNTKALERECVLLCRAVRQQTVRTYVRVYMNAVCEAVEALSCIYHPRLARRPPWMLSVMVKPTIASPRPAEISANFSASS